MFSEFYIYLIIIIFCWTLNPFIKKLVLKSQKLNNDEYFVINHFVVSFILLIYFITLFREKKCSILCLKKLNRYDFLYITLGAITSILGARLMISVIKSQDVSFLISHIQPIIIALSFIIGYLFFSEAYSLNKALGVVFVILGIVFLNKK